MTPIINQEYYNFIQSKITKQTKIPKGYEGPDYYFLHIVVVIDSSKKFRYRPIVILRFGDNYIDDLYLDIIIFPNLTYTEY